MFKLYWSDSAYEKHGDIEKSLNNAYQLKSKAQKLQWEFFHIAKNNKSKREFKRKEFIQAYTDAINLFTKIKDTDNQFLKEAKKDYPDGYVQQLYYGLAFCQFKIAMANRFDPNNKTFFSAATENLEKINWPTLAHIVLLAECYEQLDKISEAISKMKKAASYFNSDKANLMRHKKQGEILKRKIDEFCERHKLGILTHPLEDILFSDPITLAKRGDKSILVGTPKKRSLCDSFDLLKIINTQSVSGLTLEFTDDTPELVTVDPILLSGGPSKKVNKECEPNKRKANKKFSTSYYTHIPSKPTLGDFMIRPKTKRKQR